MENKNIDPVKGSGVAFGNQGTITDAAKQNMFHTDQGHGFAAEVANNRADKWAGKKVIEEGKNNAKNGADRIVDGVALQTKYYAKGNESVAACFKNSKPKYIDPTTGRPMIIEVPKGQSKSAIEAMTRRIKKGELKEFGITDPAKASELIREGPYTYTQAKNIAKAGNIDSLIFDAEGSCVTALHAAGITALITFAINVFQGKSIEIAAERAVISGIKTGGTVFITSLIVRQFSKTKFAADVTKSVEKVLGTKISSTTKVNAITAAVSASIITGPDLISFANGEISGAQLVKNNASPIMSIAVTFAFANPVGWAALATSVAVGFFVGRATKFIPSDHEKMCDILGREFERVSKEYLLSEDEQKRMNQMITDQSLSLIIKRMFEARKGEAHPDKASSKEVRIGLRGAAKRILALRPKVPAFTDELFVAGSIHTIADSID